MFPKLLKEGSGGGGSGSILPLDGKRSGGGGWNRLKPDGPGPGGSGGGGLGSINGSKMGLTGGGPPLLLLLLLLLSFINGVIPFNLSKLFMISNSLPGWLGKFLIKSLPVPFFFQI